jgi:hypothetical protein
VFVAAVTKRKQVCPSTATVQAIASVSAHEMSVNPTNIRHINKFRCGTHFKFYPFARKRKEKLSMCVRCGQYIGSLCIREKGLERSWQDHAACNKAASNFFQ